MEATSTAAALAAMGAALDAIRHEERARLGHADRLALVTEARRVLGRTEALAGLLVAEADRARSSVVVAGTPTTSWLQGSVTATKGEAAGLIFGGRDLAERPVVRDAALTGDVTVRQARAIAKVLGSLPSGLSADQRVEAERILLGEAAQADAERLGRLGPAVLERVAPPCARPPTASSGGSRPSAAGPTRPGASRSATTGTGPGASPAACPTCSPRRSSRSSTPASSQRGGPSATVRPRVPGPRACRSERADAPTRCPTGRLSRPVGREADRPRRTVTWRPRRRRSAVRTPCAPWPESSWPAAAACPGWRATAPGSSSR